jgi:hypothetical protein
LRNLQPHVQGLRKGYRTNSVEVEYSGLVAEAYLLAYVPPYIFQAENVLEQAMAGLSFGEVLRVGFICPGPGPETIGLVRALKRHGPRRPPLDITYIDKATKGWAPAREALLDCARDRWPAPITRSAIELDLIEPRASNQLVDLGRSFDLVMLQNCANELSQNRQFGLNMRQLTGSLRPGATLVISDQALYRATDWLKRWVKELDRSFDTSVPFRDKELKFGWPNCPVIDDNLLVRDGKDLMPRRNLNISMWLGTKRHRQGGTRG